MATLKPPLTIINPLGGSQPFQPPAATWFDEDPCHFVALEARPRQRSNSYDGDSSTIGGNDDAIRKSFVSGIVSIGDSVVPPPAGGGRRGSNGTADGDDDNKNHEIVKYHAYALPRHQQQKQRPSASVLDTSEHSDSSSFISQPSAFDAAKKRAAQDNIKSLTTEISVSFPLPSGLASVETTKDAPSILSSEDDETFATGATEPTVILSRRIPILAKFSPKINGNRFLALQYTATMVRIAPVEGDNNNTRSGSSSAPVKRPPTMGRRHSFSGKSPLTKADLTGGNSNNHYTIDLSYDAIPVASKPEELPNFQEGLQVGFFGNAAPKVEEGVNPGSTSIIGGGVLWCARGENPDHNTSLDLIIVTTTSVLVYNMNLVKRQLVKTSVHPHGLAASFWYEPVSRTLVIGSYKGNAAQSKSNRNNDYGNISDSSINIDDVEQSCFPTAVMAMKTLFFSKDSNEVEKFPTFAMGAIREVSANPERDRDPQHELHLSLETFDSARLEKMRLEDDAESAVVLPTEIFLVYLYGSVYCVELGSLGQGRGIGFTKLNREAGCIHVKQQTFDVFTSTSSQKLDVESTISVGVIDNLLCLFCKKDETTHFLDVADLFSDDKRVHRESMERFDPEMHVETLSFLAPAYFLDTSGQGLLYEMSLSLPLLCQSVPPTACIIPSILRRSAPRNIIQTQIMARFSALIGKDMTALRSWIGVIVDQYSKDSAAMKFDFESTTSLLEKSSLVSFDVAGSGVALSGDIMTPKACSQVLTQTEVLQMVLLPHAMVAIKKDDMDELKFIASLCIHYFVELERRFVVPSVALQCLGIALLWRTGEDAELSSFLSAQQSQWTITRRRRQMDLPTNFVSGRMYFDHSGAIPLAETLFKIATTESAGALSRCSPSTARQIISYATIILVGSGATSIATKCLLSAGHLNDAIKICSRGTKPGSKDVVAVEVQSKDFLRVAISNARKQNTMSERCKAFYFLHGFLQQWDQSVFAMESRKIKVSRRGASEEQRMRRSFLSGEDIDTIVVEQSVLAHDCPRFPDDLFGGKESVYCQRLRAMYGYVK